MVYLYFPQQSKLVRWILSRAEFDFTIEHLAVCANVIPDVLSHVPLTHSSTTGDDLYLPPQLVTCFLTSYIFTPLMFRKLLVMPSPASLLHATLFPFIALQHISNPTLPDPRASLPLPLLLLSTKTPYNSPSPSRPDPSANPQTMYQVNF